jgi:sec-independent protein translocase protein TatA
MFRFGTQEIIVLCVVALLLFGKRLPDLARMLGKMVSEIRHQISDVKDDISSSTR